MKRNNSSNKQKKSKTSSFSISTNVAVNHNQNKSKIPASENNKLSDSPISQKRKALTVDGQMKLKAALWSLIKKIFLKMYKGLSSLKLSIQESHLSGLQTYLSHPDPEIRKLVVLIIATRMKFQKSFRNAWILQFPNSNYRASQIVISSYGNEKAQTSQNSRSNTKQLPFNQGTLLFSANNIMQVKSFDEFELGKVVISKKLEDVVDVRYNFVWFDLEVQKKIKESLVDSELDECKSLDEKVSRMSSRRNSNRYKSKAKEEEEDEKVNKEGKFSQFAAYSKQQIKNKQPPLQVLQKKLNHKFRHNSFFTPKNVTTKPGNFDDDDDSDTLNSPIQMLDQPNVIESPGQRVKSPKKLKKENLISEEKDEASPLKKVGKMTDISLLEYKMKRGSHKRSRQHHRDFSISKVRIGPQRTYNKIIEKLRANSVNPRKSLQKTPLEKINHRKKSDEDNGSFIIRRKLKNFLGSQF